MASLRSGKARVDCIMTEFIYDQSTQIKILRTVLRYQNYVLYFEIYSLKYVNIYDSK